MLLRQGTIPFPTSADNGPATAEQVVYVAPGDDNSVVLLSGYDVEIRNDTCLHWLDVDLRSRSLSGQAHRGRRRNAMTFYPTSRTWR